MAGVAEKVQKISERLVHDLLEKKLNGTFDEIVNELKPTFMKLASIMHPPAHNKIKLCEFMDKRFEEIPGSYRLSLFLACLNKTTWKLECRDDIKQFGKHRHNNNLFPPIYEMKFGIRETEALTTIGGAVKDFLGRHPTEETDLSVGRTVCQAWESNAIDAVFNELGRSRPVQKSELQTEDFWRRRGFIIANPVIEEGWFSANDMSIHHGILFPIRLLEDDDDDSVSVMTSSEEVHNVERDTGHDDPLPIQRDQSSCEAEAVMENGHETEYEETQEALMRSMKMLAEDRLKLLHDLAQNDEKQRDLTNRLFLHNKKMRYKERAPLKQQTGGSSKHENGGTSGHKNASDVKPSQHGNEPTFIAEATGNKPDVGGGDESDQDPFAIDYLIGVDESEWESNF